MATSKLNTMQALSLALFTVCDIDTTDDKRILQIVDNLLTSSDKQRVLKLALQYQSEYTL